MSCVFCQIVARQAPASFVYEDDVVAAFMSLQPTAPGECLVIPKAHVDGPIVFDMSRVPAASRSTLDEDARKLLIPPLPRRDIERGTSS